MKHMNMETHILDIGVFRVALLCTAHVYLIPKSMSIGHNHQSMFQANVTTLFWRNIRDALQERPKPLEVATKTRKNKHMQIKRSQLDEFIQQIQWNCRVGLERSRSLETTNDTCRCTPNRFSAIPVANMLPKVTLDVMLFKTNES
jgi:hypothetical protein